MKEKLSQKGYIWDAKKNQAREQDRSKIPMKLDNARQICGAYILQEVG